MVASEDIPAATQLFTPNWIVKYLVQNTLGRQWLATYPDLPLRQQMEYYIEPAEQTEEVKAQLAAITPTSLDPEALTLLDPACGSGHILVEAYDLFKAIYQERGYRSRDIPRLILEKNLFGLEIDDRAAQLAAFALLMKARADDRRIFDSEAKPNVLAFQDSQGLNAADITYALNAPINKDDVPNEYLFEEMQEEKDGLFSKKAMAEKGHVSQADIASLLELFENAKTFGSLIQVPPKLAVKLPEIEERLDDVLKYGDLTHATAHVLKPLLQQARLLGEQYDAVIANPPYMGNKYYSKTVRDFVASDYKIAKGDLYSCFLVRNRFFSKPSGLIGMITIPNWMFLSIFDQLRKWLLECAAIETLCHNGRGVFGSDFGSCAFTIRNHSLVDYIAQYKRLFDKQGSVSSNDELSNAFPIAKAFFAPSRAFTQIPGYTIAYWLGANSLAAFGKFGSVGDIAKPRQGMSTNDNARFLRRWHEVPFGRIGFALGGLSEMLVSQRKWFPYNKGGEFRKWFGNAELVVNWENDGEEIKKWLISNPKDTGTTHWSRRIINTEFYGRQGLTWTFASSSSFGIRFTDAGFLFDVNGSSLFPEEKTFVILGLLCSVVASHFLRALNPSISFQSGNIADVPWSDALTSEDESRISAIVEEAISISRHDWNNSEMAWDFLSHPLTRKGNDSNSCLAKAWHRWVEESNANRCRMKELEKENNRLFIQAYGLQDELSPEVPDDQITLYRPDREEDIKRLLSYAIGCMIGRYSLDKPGLIYAHSGNQDFWEIYHEKHDKHQTDNNKNFSCISCVSWSTYPPDDDGIIPITELAWFPDDAAERLIDFIAVAWPREHLEENLKFIADSLGPNRDEHPRDTIRRYLCQGFYKDHLQAYKRRPIYWLFSSGKQRAFQCLVYLHRYHEGTLARLRTEYVIPLQGKMAARITQLGGDIDAASSTAHRKKLEKERDTLIKQRPELQAFDEKLHHYADRRIRLDLDDGVKVNYGKFGDLLAEVKAVCGSREED